MQAMIELRQGAAIISMSGKITIGVGDIALRNAAEECLAQVDAPPVIILNMSRVTSVDSSGLGELVSTAITCTNRGRKLKLVAIPAKVSDVLHITQLIGVFEVFDTEDEALCAET